MTDRMTIETNGNVTIEDGNLVVGTAGHGIDFSAQTQSTQTTGAEILDHYEEGTWTPTVTPASGSITAQSGQLGTYTRVGREVSLHYQFVIGTIGTASGVLQITNLPFVADASQLAYVTGIARARSGASSPTELVTSGTDTIHLYGITAINSTYHGSTVYSV